MKKIVFEYLDTAYPNLYTKQTNFGDIIYGYDETISGWLYVRKDMLDTIRDLFSLNFVTADDYISEWIKTKPSVF